jgi:hypothetical protein
VYIGERNYKKSTSAKYQAWKFIGLTISAERRRLQGPPDQFRHVGWIANQARTAAELYEKGITAANTALAYLVSALEHRKLVVK